MQTHRDRLEVLVVPRPQWNQHQRDHFRSLIEQLQLTGPEMRLEIKEVSEGDMLTNRSGKRRALISQIRVPVQA